ncbi:uncharacterized protein LOC124117730 [Haliotis rufescens]|uniref:uncharacterized protein LOC124117730 n=1 Tax=Haliotis rufescens TaxID=6454 RepID=UPI00201EADDA|nr:uncharacterized protein LOC124117730 [Haliotis rufescens]
MWGSSDGGYGLLLLWLFGLGGTTGLSCYSCSGSGPNTSCEHDVKAMMTSRVNYGGVYSKDCDLEINQTMCVLETTTTDGELKTIIRGCSNGYIFSYTDIKLFSGLSPTNQTTCAVNMGLIVCLTLCQQSYCNGPQHFEPSTTADITTTHIVLRIVVIIVCMYGNIL